MDVTKHARRAVTLASLLVLAVACTTNPATGEQQFNLLSTPQEVQLGEDAEPDFLKSYGGEVQAPDTTRYVRAVGERMAAASERPDLPWEFHVVDSSVVNAFALPGGKVFVTRGLLEDLHSEAELAGVLGHEIGHVTAQHIGQQMSRGLALEAAATAVGVAGQASGEDWLQVLGVGAQVGGAVYLLSFGRDQELEADKLGIRYMTAQGYNPLGQERVLKTLEQLSQGTAQAPEFLSTHPDPGDRAKRAKKIADKKYAASERAPFYPERYKERVLDPLSKLPPPRHRGEQQRTSQRSSSTLTAPE